ncbi:MAG: TMEM165/GDT1 family protein [Betaproteobacteria bacterium]|jgi:putative Ca2+/H+ antiporter (TMEM165/GDT1 family)|nr:MAG: TMEM165/GDT1 family protein [Betaproteobacteria bacterium]TAG45823.1 MAG: TMEM165/GDT1 family protein [Betaproteobacteria bacterium]
MEKSFIATLLTVAASVFVAEIGDKTQLATMLFASDGKANLWAVFLGSSIALIAAAGIGVVAGSFVSQYVSPQLLKIIAGVGFIAIGIWTLAAR